MFPGGDPMVLIALKDAQEAQFLHDNNAVVSARARTAADPALNRPGVPGLPEAIVASQNNNLSDNVVLVLVRVAEGHAPEAVAQVIRRWKHLQAHIRGQMEGISIAKLIATAARQIGTFLVILALVSAAIVAFIIYIMTLGKIREIAVLKLIGNRATGPTRAKALMYSALRIRRFVAEGGWPLYSLGFGHNANRANWRFRLSKNQPTFLLRNW